MSDLGPASSTYVRPLDATEQAVRVLCLGPDEESVSTLTHGLARTATDVRTVAETDLGAGVERLRDERVDCVVCVGSCSDVDDVELVERVRAEQSGLPVVLAVGEGSEARAARAVNAGVDGYVPYDGEMDTGTVETLADRVGTVVEQYRSQSRFEEATDLLFTLTEYTSDTLWMFTADWSETVVMNSAYEEIWGRSVADVVANPSDFLDAVHPEDLPAVRDGMGTISEGEPADLEFRLQTGDGDRWVSVHAEPVVEDGHVEYVAGFTRDITGRREREQAIQESNDQLETLVGNLPVVVSTIDTDGVFVKTDGQGLETLGLESGDLEGSSVYEAYGEYEQLVDAVDRALGGEEVRVTLDVDGFVFETWYRPVRDEGGDVTEVVGVSRDVTRIKQREQRVEQVTEAAGELPHARSEREVAGVVVDIVDSVIGCPVTAYWSYDAESDRLEPMVASERALDVAGVSETADLPTIEPDHDEMALFASGEASVVDDYADLAAPSSPEAGLGSLLVLPLGEYGMVNVGRRATDGFDDFTRHLTEILGQTAEEALERVERERELERQREALERSNENLQQFAYVASHDLQEPLRMVSSYVSLLEAEYGDQFDEEAEEYMHYAVDGATRMQEMIDALLQYSRVHTRGGAFDETDTEAVVDETLQSLQLLATEEDATVSRGDLPPVTADRSQVGQLLQNLLKNAIHHGGPGATVEVDATREGDRVHFTVADDGDGIDSDHHDRIFEIFEQHSSRTDSTGIGLAMCERIVERHDGEIWVASEPGDGATFHFTLPAAGATESGPRRSVESARDR